MDIASDGSLFIAKPEPLSDLLNGIDNHKIALPNFQRPWCFLQVKIPQFCKRFSPGTSGELLC